MTKEQVIQFIKKYFTGFRVISAVAIILAVIIIYNFGWKKIEANIYQRGVTAGQIQGSQAVINWEIQQLQLNGTFGLIVPLQGGGTTTINLIKQ